MGNFINYFQKPIRNLFKKNNHGEFWGGVVLSVSLIVISMGVTYAFQMFFYRIENIFGVVFEIVICYQLLGAKCLKDESMKVYHEILSGDINRARKAVSMIVGRDTAQLDFEQVNKAVVETVAENTSDGVVAPIMFIALFGTLGGVFYKAINTLDSMIGYKNDRYLYFGRFSAKIDDVVNFIPARISGLFIIVSSAILGYDSKNSAKIFIRDRRNHSSPNSAQTESACAGALNIQLAGDAYYFGELHRKPTIGDSIKTIEPSDIIKTNKLMYCTSILTLLVCIIFLILR